MPRAPIFALLALIAMAGTALAQSALPWTRDFPETDFARRSIDLSEIVTSGRKDSIPPIDNPQFVPLSDISNIGELEPVLSIAY
ncbi:MAG: hypothetical protein ACTSX7_12555 [Alphaproteobacteria bacterium]